MVISALLARPDAGEDIATVGRDMPHEGRDMHPIHSLTRTTSRKLLTSAAALGIAASVAGLGSFAAFTGSTSASQDVSTGVVEASIGAAGGADNRLTVAADNIAAGDTIQRAVTLTNTGTIDWSTVALTTTATSTSLLDTDATFGLQLAVDSCDVPWTEAGAAPAYTYTCGGSTSALIASRSIIGSSIGLGALNSLSVSGGPDYLRATLSLPSTADNTFQGLASTIDFEFGATQRTATDA